jgi:hypothetical protein
VDAVALGEGGRAEQGDVQVRRLAPTAASAASAGPATAYGVSRSTKSS